jgi:hypothetical protein
MAYINQEMKQVIANNLKPVLAKYKVKGSLSIEHNSKITLTLRSGAVDFKKEYIGTLNDGTPKELLDMWHPCYKDFTGTSSEFIQQAWQALESANWYDNSNGLIDYFDTAYYIVITFKPNGKEYKLIS